MSFATLCAGMDKACISLLGESTPFSYKPANAPAVAVLGIFDENYVDIKAQTEHGINAVGPAAFFRLQDLPTDPRNDNPLITAPNGKMYRIKEVQPDSVGGVLITLKRVAA